MTDASRPCARPTAAGAPGGGHTPVRTTDATGFPLPDDHTVPVRTAEVPGPAPAPALRDGNDPSPIPGGTVPPAPRPTAPEQGGTVPPDRVGTAPSGPRTARPHPAAPAAGAGRRGGDEGPVLGRFLARAAAVTAVLTAAGSLFGLVRDQSIARLFGADADTDAFLVAWTVPELASTLLIEDAMALILVPAFSLALSRRTARGDQAADPVRALVASTLPRLALGLAAAAGLLAAAAPQVVQVLAPGLPAAGTAASCLRLTALTVLTFGLAGYFSAALRAHRRFVAPAAIYVAYNTGIIGVMFAGHGLWGVRAAALGVAAGGALMVLVQLPSFLAALPARPAVPAGRRSGPAGTRPRRRPFAVRTGGAATGLRTEGARGRGTAGGSRAGNGCGPEDGRSAEVEPGSTGGGTEDGLRPGRGRATGDERRAGGGRGVVGAREGRGGGRPGGGAVGLGVGALAPVVVFAVSRQAQVLFERFVASSLPAGAISHLNYAQKVAQLPMVLSLMVCTVTFPVVARAMAEGDAEAARRRVERDLALAGIVVLLGAAYVVACAPQLIGVLFERGAFDARDTAATAAVMRVYTCGLLGHSMVGALVRPFFSGGRPPWYPAAAMGAGLAVTTAAAVAAVGPWGVYGIAAANALGITTTAALLLRGLGARVVAIDVPRVAAGLLKLTLTAGVAAAAGWAAAAAAGSPLPSAALGGVAVLVTFGAVGVLVGAPELPHLFATVRRRFPHVH